MDKDFIEKVLMDQNKAYVSNLKLITATDAVANVHYRKLFTQLVNNVDAINVDKKKFLDNFNSVYGSQLQKDMISTIKGNIVKSTELGAYSNEQIIISKLGENTSILDNAIKKAYTGVMTGSIYKDGLSIEQRIAKNVNYDMNRLNEIILNSFANENANYKKLAKVLNENFYNGNTKAAVRTARTTINHGFRMGTIEASRDNPFVSGVQWMLSGSHPKDDECNDYSVANDYKLGKGVYPVDNVPFSHPNCLCYLVPVVKD